MGVCVQARLYFSQPSIGDWLWKSGCIFLQEFISSTGSTQWRASRICWVALLSHSFLSGNWICAVSSKCKAETVAIAKAILVIHCSIKTPTNTFLGEWKKAFCSRGNLIRYGVQPELKSNMVCKTFYYYFQCPSNTSSHIGVWVAGRGILSFSMP